MSMVTMGKVLNDPAVRERLFTPRKEDNDYDIPYIAGYSKKGDTIFYDRHLPEIIKLNLDGQHKEINPRNFIRMHETLEKSIIDALGWGYFQAHAAATAYERRSVFQTLGPQWWMPYQHAMDGYAKADEHEKVTSVPKDLDMTPYMTSPVNKALLAAMHKAMGGKAKDTKKVAEYGEGKPSEHCGPVEHWPERGECTHYLGNNCCELVSGHISIKGWCKHWERN